jgi:hypothetical protein
MSNTRASYHRSTCHHSHYAIQSARNAQRCLEPPFRMSLLNKEAIIKSIIIAQWNFFIGSRKSLFDGDKEREWSCALTVFRRLFFWERGMVWTTHETKHRKLEPALVRYLIPSHCQVLGLDDRVHTNKLPAQ